MPSRLTSCDSVRCGAGCLVPVEEGYSLVVTVQVRMRLVASTFISLSLSHSRLSLYLEAVVVVFCVLPQAVSMYLLFILLAYA